MRNLVVALVETWVSLEVDELDVDEINGRCQYQDELLSQLPASVVWRARALADEVALQERALYNECSDSDEDVPF